MTPPQDDAAFETLAAFVIVHRDPVLPFNLCVARLYIFALQVRYWRVHTKPQTHSEVHYCHFTERRVRKQANKQKESVR